LATVCNVQTGADRREVPDFNANFNYIYTEQKYKLNMDYRKRRTKHVPILINGAVVE
jgi:hypothetical protein